MNRINYATDLIADAQSLLLANLNQFDSAHVFVIRRIAAQVSLYREAAMLCKGVGLWGTEVSEELKVDVDAMLGHEVMSMKSSDLLDEYVGCRLDSTINSLNSLMIGYLESSVQARQSIGCVLFEAEHWLRAAANVLILEANELTSQSLEVAA